MGILGIASGRVCVCVCVCVHAHVCAEGKRERGISSIHLKLPKLGFVAPDLSSSGETSVTPVPCKFFSVFVATPDCKLLEGRDWFLFTFTIIWPSLGAQYLHVQSSLWQFFELGF